ncbi:MAG: toxic anion resistance protein [Clostridia bacterium]|nr:toxic anion resistance protein [Clostridia bacterium]
MENGIPELTLTSGAAAAADPVPTAADAANDVAAPEGFVFTEEEQKQIDEFSEKIDITDSTMVLSYGAPAQKKVSEFSDAALEGVRTKDFGQTGEMISNLISQLKGLNDDQGKGGFFGLFRKTKNKIESMKIKYAKAEESVSMISGELERHQVVLLKDITTLDKLYEMNLDYLKELTMYIAAGKKKLAYERENTLPEYLAKAKETGLPEDAQAANDFSEICDRFDRKLHDLELTRMVAIQMAPQIRLLQNNDSMMSEKIQTVLVNTIPLWKSQMVLALGIAHSEEAMKAQRSVTDMTNELLRQNAETLHTSTVEIAKETERGIVDMETLTHTNEQLIATLDEVQQIHAEGREKRAEAEAKLRGIENELRQKLLEVNGEKEESK